MTRSGEREEGRGKCSSRSKVAGMVMVSRWRRYERGGERAGRDDRVGGIGVGVQAPYHSCCRPSILICRASSERFGLHKRSLVNGLCGCPSHGDREGLRESARGVVGVDAGCTGVS